MKLPTARDRLSYAISHLLQARLHVGTARGEAPEEIQDMLANADSDILGVLNSVRAAAAWLDTSEEEIDAKSS